MSKPPPRRLPGPAIAPQAAVLLLAFLFFSSLRRSRAVEELQLQATNDLALPANASLPALIDRTPLESCPLGPSQPLKVYVYDLHQKFNFGLFTREDLDSLPHKPEGTLHLPYRRRDDGTVAGQGFEHSAEAYVTLDLLSNPTVNGSTTQGNEIVRVSDPADADVYFVPFLASLSFNKFSRDGMHTSLVEHDRRLQEELYKILTSSEWWQRSGGHDHILGMVQPNALRFVRTRIHRAMFLVADFGRCPHSVSHLSKDIVVPYHHMLATFHEDPADGDATWERRKMLLYFQGTVKRKNEGYIRKLLHVMLHKEPDVHFANSRADAEGIKSATDGMRSAKFCLHAAGDTPSSCRLFDAIVSHCVPVIVSNKLELPFESAIDYSEFSVILSHKEAFREGHLLQILRRMPKEEWLRRWRRILEVGGNFEFQVPSVKGDAVSMMWREVRSKLPQIRRLINEYQRQLVAKLS